MSIVSPIDQMIFEEIEELQSMRLKYIELGKQKQAEICQLHAAELIIDLGSRGIDVASVLGTRYKTTSPAIEHAIKSAITGALVDQSLILKEGRYVAYPTRMSFKRSAGIPLSPFLKKS